MIGQKSHSAWFRPLLVAALVVQFVGVGAAFTAPSAEPTEADGTPETTVPEQAARPPSAPTTSEADDLAVSDDTTAPTEPTQPPEPTTTTPPPPPPTTAAAPPPSPAPAPPAPPAAPASTRSTIEERFARVVPASWRAAVPARLEVVPGSTSWAHPSGLIQISSAHANGDPSHLDVVIAHEFGHLIAFRFGTMAYSGAAPGGWPVATANPAEHWADCVQKVWSGFGDPSHGLPACSGDQLGWARSYLASGPS